MHLCCRGSHGDRGTEPSRGGWSCQGAVVDGGTGRTRCLNGVTDPRPRGGEGQQATARTDGGAGPQTAPGQRGKGRVETPNHHIQPWVALASPAHQPQDRDPRIPRAAQLQQQQGGTQTQGLRGTATGVARLSAPWPWRVLVCEMPRGAGGRAAPAMAPWGLHHRVPSTPTVPRPPEGPSPAPGAAPSADTQNRNPAEDEERELGERAEVWVPWGTPGEGGGGRGAGFRCSFALALTSAINATNLHHPGRYQTQPCSPRVIGVWARPCPTSTSEDFLTSCGIGIRS